MFPTSSGGYGFTVALADEAARTRLVKLQARSTLVAFEGGDKLGVTAQQYFDSRGRLIPTP